MLEKENTLFKTVFVVVLCFLISLPATKLLFEVNSSRQRGTLARSIIRGQFELLKNLRPLSSEIVQNESQQSILVKSLFSAYLINQSLKEVLSTLDSTFKQESFRNRVKEVEDGKRALVQFLELDEPLDLHELLDIGRGYYYQAVALEKLGKQTASKVYYLISAHALIRFLYSDPSHIDIPEVLFFVGTSFLKFRDFVPSHARIDRILNLCDELYPNSLWAERARSSWNREVRDDA